MSRTTSRRLWKLALFYVGLWSVAACTQETTWEKYMKAGVKASAQGRYADAEKAFLAALKEAERFGPQDPRLASSLNNMAEVYLSQGRYAQAEPLYQRSLTIREKALGPEHPDLAGVLGNYAVLLQGTNRDAEAAAMEARAKAIRVKDAQQNPTN